MNADRNKDLSVQFLTLQIAAIRVNPRLIILLLQLGERNLYALGQSLNRQNQTSETPR
jgi:hypothetical protein